MTTRRTLIAGVLLGASGIGRFAGAGPVGVGRPIVIAHRGASGERPEETRLAYELAIDEGADFIEPDLVPTKDGHLVCRHEPEIGGTTDVARRPEFSDRKASYLIDGETVTGWFTHDFTLAELKSLRCRERLPELRPESARYDGRAPILTYQEVIDIARTASQRTGRVIGTYPEMKHPTFFAARGLQLEARLAAVLKANGLDAPGAPVFVQCFEVGALKTFSRMSRAPRIQLIDRTGGPADLAGRTYAEMITPSGLAAIRAYADGIGPSQAMVLDMAALPGPVPTPLVARAHAQGLKVHCWTARKENVFLPRSLQVGDPAAADFPRQTGNIDALLHALYAAGVDGVFSDFTAVNVRARAAFLGHGAGAADTAP